MKVWVVVEFEDHYGFDSPLKAFTSEEKAQAFADAQPVYGHEEFLVYELEVE